MDRDRHLLHQVHAAKLTTDITVGIVSTVVMWRRRVVSALLIAHVPAVVASVLVMRLDLSRVRDTRGERYVLAHMPSAAQAVRLLGQIIAWRAAYRHWLGGIIAGP